MSVFTSDQRKAKILIAQCSIAEIAIAAASINTKLDASPIYCHTLIVVAMKFDLVCWDRRLVQEVNRLLELRRVVV